MDTIETKQFLLDYEVEAHGCLEEGIDTLQSVHPSQDYEVHIKNLEVTPGVDRPLLSIQIILKAQTINEAEEKGEDCLLDYLRILTLVTNLTFSIHKLIRVIDWTIGIKERECIQYESFPGAQLPYAVLTKEHFKTVETLLGAKFNPKVKRSLKWFSSGVSARYIEDQFQFFWFAIEVLASFYKDDGKVNDLCSRCRSPLYCKTCDEYPSHRPYPKQAINQLIEKFRKDEPQTFVEAVNKIRNSLMHGDEIDSIEEELKVSLSDVVNDLGQIVWIAIITAIMKSFDKTPVFEKLSILSTNMYSHQVMKSQIHLKVFSKDPNSPKLEDLAKVSVSLIISEKPESSEKI